MPFKPAHTLHDTFTDKKWQLLLLALLLPLVFIYIAVPHNWGDDFAQYIMHSNNMCRGANPFETHYLYNSHYPAVSPPAYPLGFPAMLMPVGLLAPHSLIAYKIYMQLFVVLLGILSFMLFSLYFNKPVSLILSIIICYNPFILEFKTQILSDIPFAVLFIAACLAIKKKKHAAWIGLIIACAVFTRSVGIALLLAYVVYRLIALPQNRPGKKDLLQWCWIICLPCLVFVLNTLTNEDSYQHQFMNSNNVFITMYDNFQVQINILNNFLIPGFSEFKFYRFTWFIPYFVVLVGVVCTLKKGPQFIIYAFVLYELVILSYPYQYATFRLLIPIIPLYILFLASGSRKLIMLTGLVHRKKIFYPVGVLFFAVLFIPPSMTLSKRLYATDGPESKESRMLFGFISTHTQPDDRFIFSKPKALGYFCSRKCVTNAPTDSLNRIVDIISQYYCRYIVISTNIDNKPLADFVKQCKPALLPVYHNRVFTVYRIPMHIALP